MKVLIGHMVVGNGQHGKYDINTSSHRAYIFVPISDDNLAYYTARGYLSARGYLLMPVYGEDRHVELVNNEEFDELELILES